MTATCLAVLGIGSADRRACCFGGSAATTTSILCSEQGLQEGDSVRCSRLSGMALLSLLSCVCGLVWQRIPVRPAQEVNRDARGNGIGTTRGFCKYGLRCHLAYTAADSWPPPRQLASSLLTTG
ncbi:hypothetical protein ABPG75_003332 [Micractinium tetrahymenae]